MINQLISDLFRAGCEQCEELPGQESPADNGAHVRTDTQTVVHCAPPTPQAGRVQNRGTEAQLHHEHGQGQLS